MLADIVMEQPMAAMLRRWRSEGFNRDISTMKCAACGSESASEHQFIKQPFSTRFLCEPCDLRNTQKIAKIILLAVALTAIVLLFEILFTDKLTDDPQSLQIGEFVSLLCLFQILCIIPHELAHAAAAWLLGFRIKLICLGRGGLLARWKMRGVDCEIRSWPMCGIVEVICPALPAARFRRIAIVAAAPLSNLLIAMIAMHMAGSPAAVFVGKSLHAAQTAWWALASANCLLIFGSLWPGRGNTSLGQKKSDGSQLLELIFGIGKLNGD